MKYIGFFLVLIFASCTEQIDNTLTYDELRTVDSLYSRRSKEIKKETDSLCQARYKELFNSLADSIKQEYIAEIEQIIK